jgi:hypothetical protein
MKYKACTTRVREGDIFELPEGVIGITVVLEYAIIIEETEQIVTIGNVEEKMMLQHRVPEWIISYLVPEK